jgi:hypothetical protein
MPADAAISAIDAGDDTAADVTGDTRFGRELATAPATREESGRTRRTSAS